jgi:hypothetical protein
MYRQLILDHYGLDDMQFTIMTREEDIAQYELDHPEVPPVLWDAVDHDLRLVREWARADICIDLIADGRLVQDVCFIDAYANAGAWHAAVLALVRKAVDLRVVRHRG